MVRVFKFVVMRAAKASGLAKSNLTVRFTWGVPAYEQEGVLARRGVFAHPYREQELDVILDGITQDPNVEVLDEIPADWRYPVGN